MQNRTRCHFIGIHTPPDDTQKRVTFCREAIIEDDAGTMLGKALEQPADIVVPFMPGLATATHTVTDPVTGQSVSFSGAALAAWITAEYEARNTAAEIARTAQLALADANNGAALEPTPVSDTPVP